MSTRAVYSFIDPPCPQWTNETFHVYKHFDGYPSGAAVAIAKALPFAWSFPRFEADEFAAAFVAGNKVSNDPDATLGGNVRLLRTGRVQDVAPGDIAYRYEVTFDGRGLRVTAYRTNYWDDDKAETCIFTGTFAAFSRKFGGSK